MKNENLMAIVVIGLIAITALQTFQIFAMGQTRTQRMSSTGMMSASGMMGSSGAQQFSSTEEMMAAHHGSSASGCGGH